MTTVQSVIAIKGQTVITVTDEISISDAAKILRNNGIGALVVLDGGGAIVGIYSERDIVRDIADHGAIALDQPVRLRMTRKVVCCAPGDDIKSIMRTMTQRRFRHMPVLDRGRLAGIISIGDVVKSRLTDMELEANVLRDVAIAGR